jgi:Ion transport protein
MNKGKAKPGTTAEHRSPNMTVDDSKMVILDESSLLPPLVKGKNQAPNFKIDIPDVIGRTTVDSGGIMDSSSPQHARSRSKPGANESAEISKLNTFNPFSKQSLNSVVDPKLGTNTKFNSVHPTLENSNLMGSNMIAHPRQKAKGMKLLNSNTSGDLAGTLASREKLKQGGTQDLTKKESIFLAQIATPNTCLKKIYEVYNNNSIASQVTAAVIMVSIFGDDLRRVTLRKSEDVYVDYFMLFLMIFFILEILMNVVIQKSKYLLSFAILFDIISTMSMVLDMTFIAEVYLNDSSADSSTQTASALGARLGKLLRMVRLVRLLRLSKALTKSHSARKGIQTDPNIEMLKKLESDMLNLIKARDPSYAPPSLNSLQPNTSRMDAEKIYQGSESKPTLTM